MNNIDLFKRYLPIFMEDKNEPFRMTGIGCTMYTESGRSVSSRFEINIEKETDRVLEYALFWDFDIQHLYDLEHVFIYLNKEGKVTDLISSFHGKFYRQSDVEFKNDSPVLFLQPGKHAVMAHPEYFRLFVDYFDACNKKAGSDGVLIPDFLENRITKNESDDALTEDYIKKSYAFNPAGVFKEAGCVAELLTDFEGLKDHIVSSVKRELTLIRKNV